MNHYKNGMMGLVVADALGVPYEFKSREKIALNPCVDMIGYGTFNVEEGCWSDDSSMAIATLDALIDGYNPTQIMENFIKWYKENAYTPFGEVFDMGMVTGDAMDNYLASKDITTCGLNSEYSNGNGSLMRILPLCIYLCKHQIPTDEAIEKVHEVSALTHAHMRSKVACGIYYFLVKAMIEQNNPLEETIKKGLQNAFMYYHGNEELSHFTRIQYPDLFKQLPISCIKSGGYVVESLEASIYCLLNNTTYKDTVLQAVNLGFDTDTTAAIVGGLAGLYYTYNDIPQEWLSKIKKLDYILQMCDTINKK